MPLIVTPGHLDRSGQFYHQLAQLTAAGVPLLAALRHLEQNPPARRYRKPIHRLRAGLEDGAVFSEALQRSGLSLPAFDLALVRAGETSGRFEQCCRVLADTYAQRAAMARTTLLGLAYPVLLIHAAVFIMPFPDLFLSGNWQVFMKQTLGVLALPYALVFAFLLAGQGRHGEGWRGFVEAVVGAVPVLGRARRELALSRLALLLEALLSAGLPIDRAWEMAVDGSGSPRLRRAAAKWPAQIEEGLTPAELVRRSRAFPEMFANLYGSGEISGKLEDTLRRLHAYYLDEGGRRMKLFSRAFPFLVYLVIVAFIALKVLSFWWSHYNNLLNLGG